MVYINLVYNFSFGKSKSGVKLKMQNKDKDSGILNRYWFTLQKISNIVHKDFIRCRFLYGLYRYINLNLYKNTRLYIIGCKTGCLFCNLLIFSVYCGERGFWTCQPILSVYQRYNIKVKNKCSKIVAHFWRLFETLLNAYAIILSRFKDTKKRTHCQMLYNKYFQPLHCYTF